MSLVPHADQNHGMLLSPGGMEAAQDLIDLGLEPIADLGDEDVANAVSAGLDRDESMCPYVDRCLNAHRP